MHTETKMVVQALIRALWPGKFPQTSCFAKKKQKGHGRLRMGAHGFAWVQWGVFARGDRKTRENEAKIGKTGHVFQRMSTAKKADRHQGWSWWSERIMGRNRGESNSAPSSTDICKKPKSKKTNNGGKKKGKQAIADRYKTIAKQEKIRRSK